MKNIYIINGPNLNMVGVREPSIYGQMDMCQYIDILIGNHSDCNVTYFQSNVEGDIINKIQQIMQDADALIINPGGYSHTSVAIADAISLLSVPVVEVHISNIYKRESYRHQSITGSKCLGVISGLGLKGYSLALMYLKEELNNQK